MFIHIGNNNVVRSGEIISIVDCSMIESSSIMKEMVHSLNKKGNMKGKSSSAKSMIITVTNVYYSSLTIPTLKKRTSIGKMVHKIKDYSKID